MVSIELLGLTRVTNMLYHSNKTDDEPIINIEVPIPKYVMLSFLSHLVVESMFESFKFGF